MRKTTQKSDHDEILSSQINLRIGCQFMCIINIPRRRHWVDWGSTIANDHNENDDDDDAVEKLISHIRHRHNLII